MLFSVWPARQLAFYFSKKSRFQKLLHYYFQNIPETITAYSTTDRSKATISWPTTGDKEANGAAGDTELEDLQQGFVQTKGHLQNKKNERVGKLILISSFLTLSPYFNISK